MFFRKSAALNNQRSFRRLKARLLIKYSLPEAYAKETVVNLKNISSGGISFITERPLDPGSLLEIQIFFLPKEYLIKAKGKVVWAKNDVKFNKYAVGVKFMELADSDKELLEQYVDRAISSSEGKRFSDEYNK